MNNKRPNVIYIMADDLGYYDLSCYGQEEIRTPHIDQMAWEGIRFTHCYAGSSLCAPARSVLMTGQHAGHTRIRHNKALVGGIEVQDNGPLERRVSLAAEDATVAEMLQQAGYVTGMIGKWGIAEPGTAGEPNQKGFDEWFGYMNQRRAHNHFPTYLWHNGQKMMIPENEGGQKSVYAHDLFEERALSFISSYSQHPFFLYLPFTLPHAAYEIPDNRTYAERPWSTAAKNYAAMVERIDTFVGKLLALLKTAGCDDDTIVFFTSDNGGLTAFRDVFHSTGPFRGGKRDLYEGGIRVPMIVRWPGKIPAGIVSDRYWYFADVFPTLAELAGTQPPLGLDGTSVVPTLLGEPQPELAGRYLYWELCSDGVLQQAVRYGHWKAVRSGLDGPLELYDLRTDAGEVNDQADDHPDVVNRIEDYLSNVRTASAYWPVAGE